MLKKVANVWEPQVCLQCDHMQAEAVLRDCLQSMKCHPPLPCSISPTALLQAVIAFLNELVTRSAIREELAQPGTLVALVLVLL